MKKMHLLLISVMGVSLSAFAQQAGTIESDLSQEVKSLEAPPIKFDFNMGYQSNMDLVDNDESKYPDQGYKDNPIMNIGAKTEFKSELFDMPLSYKPSFISKFIQDENLRKSNDVVRQMTINNALFLNMTSGNDKLAFGPTLSLGVEKKYIYEGFHRKRDNVNGAIGLQADLKATSKLALASSISAGYLDHSGNYVNQLGGRVFEHNLQEDRAIYNANLTGVMMLSPSVSLSLPISYKRENYTQKRARASIISPAMDRDLKTWTAVNGAKPMDEALELAYTTVGIGSDIKLGMIATNVGYTVMNVDEINKGQNRNDQDVRTISLGASTEFDALSIALAYVNENIFYRNLGGGGGTDITQTYSASLIIPKVMDDTNATFSVSHRNYQEELPYYDGGHSAAEQATDTAAMIGIATTL